MNDEMTDAERVERWYHEEIEDRAERSGTILRDEEADHEEA